MIKKFMRKLDCNLNNEWPDYFLKDIKDVEHLPKPREVNTHFVLECHCEKHGDYITNVSNKLRGFGCRSCSKDKMWATIKKNKIYPKRVYDDLEGSPDLERVLQHKVVLKDKLQFMCKKHGPYFQRLSDHIQGQSCPKCRIDKLPEGVSKARRNKNPFPDWFMKDLEGSPDLEKAKAGKLYGYDSALFMCKIHGLYSQRVSDHLYSKAGCQQCAIESRTWQSNLEKELAQYYESQGYRVYSPCRSVIRSEVTGLWLELDIYFPDYKVAVEFNGLYYHSYQYLVDYKESYTKNQVIDYHYQKSKQCISKEIRLLHIFGDVYDRVEFIKDWIDFLLGKQVSSVYSDNYFEVRKGSVSELVGTLWVSYDIKENYIDVVNFNINFRLENIERLFDYLSSKFSDKRRVYVRVPIAIPLYKEFSKVSTFYRHLSPVKYYVHSNKSVRNFIEEGNEGFIYDCGYYVFYREIY